MGSDTGVCCFAWIRPIFERVSMSAMCVLRKLDRSRGQIFRHLAPEDYAWGLTHGPVMSRREFREDMVSAGHARGYGAPEETFADQACLDGDAFGGKSAENDKE